MHTFALFRTVFGICSVPPLVRHHLHHCMWAQLVCLEADARPSMLVNVYSRANVLVTF